MSLDTVPRWAALCGGRRRPRTQAAAGRQGGFDAGLGAALDLLFSGPAARGRVRPSLAAGGQGALQEVVSSQAFEDAFVAAAAIDSSLIWDALGLPNLDPRTRRRLLELVRRALADLLRLIRPRYERARAVRAPARRRTRRPRQHEINWLRTIGANLTDYVPARGVIAPRRLLGATRRARRVELEDVVVCIDQSGSMLTAAIPTMICAALMGASPAVRTRIVLFDTEVVDVTELVGAAEAGDARFVETLLDAILRARAKLGGGTYIGAAVRYCQRFVTMPDKTHFLLVSDLYDNAGPQAFVDVCLALARDGVNAQVIAPLEAGCAELAAGSLEQGGVRVRRPAQEGLIEALADSLQRRR